MGSVLALSGCPSNDDDFDSADDGPAVDLADGGEVALRLLQLLDMRYLVHGNHLGLVVADGGCPAEVDEHRWVGGCTTPLGYVFEGELVRSDPGGGSGPLRRRGLAGRG